MAFTIDGTNGLTFNNATTQASAGCVLQVVNSAYSTQVTNSTDTFADSGLTATITPKFSTSKILILISSLGMSNDTNGVGVKTNLLRNSTTLVASISAGLGSNSAYAGATSSFTYLDSPATTSSTTYKTQFKRNSASGTAFAQQSSDYSSITLMEIAV
jgi:hypothetical protein